MISMMVGATQVARRLLDQRYAHDIWHRLHFEHGPEKER